LDLVEHLIDQGAAVNTVQAFGDTYSAYRFQPIDLALWTGVYWGQRNDYVMAGYLIARGADYSITIAAALGDLARVKKLLDDNSNLIHDAQPCGKRPLSAAAERGHTEIVKLLLQRGADPKLPEGSTATRGMALFAACCQNNLELAQMLLEHGADPNSGVDSSGSCLYKASMPEMKRLLFMHGAKPLDAFSYIWQENIDVVASMAYSDSEKVGRSGCGGAFAAVCTKGKRDWMHMLLKLGVRVPDVLTGCRTYLWTHADMTRVLLEHGMNPNLPDWQHVTPLHNLCGRDGHGRSDPNRLELADLFLEFGADINAIDEEYRSTPLGWAARNNLPDMIELLLKRGAHPNAAGAPWAKPLAWAERRGHAEIAALLRQAGADP
jgi:ankyrin repeat protein